MKLQDRNKNPRAYPSGIFVSHCAPTFRRGLFISLHPCANARVFRVLEIKDLLLTDSLNNRYYPDN